MTIEQAAVIAKAVNLLARLSIGQIGMIAEMVAMQEIPMYSPNGSAKREATADVCAVVRAKAAGILGDLGYSGIGHSLGVGNEHVPIAGHRAYEISRVLQKVLAEHHNPNPGLHNAMFKNLPQKSPWNPSRRAIARVLNPLPAPTVCPFCASPVSIEGNSAVYGKSYGHWPWVYLCQSGGCRAYVGMHPFTNIPLGTLADEATREARKLSKELFNPLWARGEGTEGTMSRTEAYEWLAAQLGIPVAECHFGWFDVAMCRRAYRAIIERNKKGA